MIDQDSKANARREALKKMGLAAGVAVAGALVPNNASAAAGSCRSPFGTTTKISGLGLLTEHVALLTPAAKNLTKADLLSLAAVEAGAGAATGPAKGLTPADIKSIKSAWYAFNNAPVSAAGGQMAADIEIKCCCCPCCCAAATTAPQRSGVA